MSINGIGTNGWGQSARQKGCAKGGMGPDTGVSFAKQMIDAAGAGNTSGTRASDMGARKHIIYMKTDDMLYSGGNGAGLSFYLKYAKDSTEDDPVVIAKGVDENGREFTQRIHINNIDPRNATLVEMRALEGHKGVDKNGGLSSLPPGTGMMGLNDRADFIAMFQRQIRDMNLLKQGSRAAYYQYSMMEYMKV
ncbi:MAG: hypothetical protein HFG94_11300 [Dorea sp.]|nr:hypothetical protein [Dorea sp.]